MGSGDGFTIVVPTRDDPTACEQLLEGLLGEPAQVELTLRVVFLANDTQASATERLEEIVSKDRFAPLQPQMVRATQSWATAEENIRFTLGDHLDAVDDCFLIVGNTDHVDLAALKNAVLYLRQHQLHLLLVGFLNRQAQGGRTLRQMYLPPWHITGQNRLAASRCHGKQVFSDAMTDYGPVSFLSFIGCQVYSKDFFRALCKVQDQLPERMFSLSIGSLELTTSRQWEVGFSREAVTVRVDHQPGPESLYPQPWDDPALYRHRIERGLSRHTFFAVISNSLHISPPAFATLVNCHLETVGYMTAEHIFSNLLYEFVKQLAVNLGFSRVNPEYRYSASERAETVEFGHRLRSVAIGLPPGQSASVSTWIEQMGAPGIYDESETIKQLLSASGALLRLLDSRPGKARWLVRLL